MHKKLMMACMAIAAFAAFVVAPAASASPALTSEGKLVPVGTSITAVNTGVTKFTGSITVECDHDHLTGTVLKNTGSLIEGTIPIGAAKFNGTAEGTDCTSTLVGAPANVNVTSELCVVTVEASDNAKTTGCLGNPIKFILNLTTQGPCEYSTASVTGKYITSAAATVNLSEQEAKLIKGGFFCPSSGKLDMDFDLYTTDGTALTIS